METGNYVAQLNEYAQRQRCVLHFEDQGSVGPDHNRTFIQRAVLNGKVYPDGQGKTKKDAKKSAAKNALEFLLMNEHQDSVHLAEEAAGASAASFHQPGVSNINYICWLNEYGQKNRVRVKPEESKGLGSNTFCCCFMVGDKEYPTVTGKTKREAKEEAAKLVYDVICASKTSETAGEPYNHTSTQQNEEPNVSDLCNRTRSLNVSLNSSLTETNYIGLVNHYCQKTKRSLAYIEERRCGPSHNPQFFYKLVISKKSYPEGEGTTVKEAKQNAARLAWSALQEQSDWDSKVSISSTVSEDGAPPTWSGPSTTPDTEESSSQSIPVSSAGSIIFADSSNPSNAQIRFGSAMSEDDPSTRESPAPPQGIQMYTTSSGVFTDSSNSSEVQHAVGYKNMGAKSRFTTDFDDFARLGNGAFGCVYKARHKLLKKYFAVKIVCCEEKSLREVSTLSDLQQPNIVRYYTFWMEDSGYQWDISDDSYSSSQSVDSSSAKFLYIQMELCDTRTLKVWINNKNNESLQDSTRREESLNIVQQIVSGVEYIHSKKHIHRDLKPANILFGLDGKVKIGDFGLVTRDNDGALIDRTENKGTPTYMAPEQKKERNYDRKVDIFPLGLIYFELLWKVSSEHERGRVLLKARCQKFPKEFSLTFHREKHIIKSMLCEKPEGRPEASTLKAELEKFKRHVFCVNRFTSEFDSIVCLGKGAFGRVFKATKKLTGKKFAMKIVLWKEKALREVKALSDLHHCNIVRYYTCWLEDSGYQWDDAADSCSSSQSSIVDSSVGYLYIQMELCDTETLREWIDKKNMKRSLRDSKRREESLTIAKQIVSGVEYIHSKMLIHRDLKPANIMFGRDGEVKIGDFGLVTAENDDDAESLMERTVYKGTPSYMAPEQKSKKTYDQKVDIYALGLICFELFWNISTGHERQTVWDDVRRQNFPQGFSGIFFEEYIIIKPMLCVKPEDRPEASKVKTDFEECTCRNSTQEIVPGGSRSV
ncbi:interferon-induced, double-stranded RNA-activated protein kinase-like [Chelmon rostratus]|uniref:interferon-induced, double-stranded RNA-activated protein kinase-like n=1 Tax=Chelmon rostratus TaxID=109905 RepID=UPI001BE6FBD1|nr:interferon-induced, double-stranded RNA-activated protein kinase-like [Chelmon rostratus]